MIPYCVASGLSSDCHLIPLSALTSKNTSLLKIAVPFATGLRANNALLWGARGTGKSSLVKSVHGQLISEGFSVGLVEIQREDLSDLPDLMDRLAQLDRRFMIYCDDLAFEHDDVSYKSLKAVLEGGLSGRLRISCFMLHQTDAI